MHDIVKTGWVLSNIHRQLIVIAHLGTYCS